MPNGTLKGGNASEPVQTGSDEGGATVTPPDDRGEKEKRGEDDNERQWWEEGCDGVAMVAIHNQLGAAERRWTRDNDDDYDRDYVDDRGNDDDEDDGRGDWLRWRWGRERRQSLPLPP